MRIFKILILLLISSFVYSTDPAGGGNKETNNRKQMGSKVKASSKPSEPKNLKVEQQSPKPQVVKKIGKITPNF